MPDAAARSEIWVIDTSSILELRRKAPASKQGQIYARLGEMVEADILVYPKEVLDELERRTAEIAGTGRRDLPYEWAKKHEKQATRHGTDYAALRYVLSVEGVAQLLDADNPGVEEADPYVLALAHHLNANDQFSRVVTEDRRNAPDKIALASACGIVGVPVVPMRPFLLNRGIWNGPWGT